jgi:hypothetical protein
VRKTENLNLGKEEKSWHDQKRLLKTLLLKATNTLQQSAKHSYCKDGWRGCDTQREKGEV